MQISIKRKKIWISHLKYYRAKQYINWLLVNSGWGSICWNLFKNSSKCDIVFTFRLQKLSVMNCWRKQGPLSYTHRRLMTLSAGSNVQKGSTSSSWPAVPWLLCKEGDEMGALWATVWEGLISENQPLLIISLAFHRFSDTNRISANDSAEPSGSLSSESLHKFGGTDTLFMMHSKWCTDGRIRRIDDHIQPSSI